MDMNDKKMKTIRKSNQPITIVIKSDAKNLDDLEETVEKIAKIQKEYSCNCTLFVNISLAL